MAWISEICVAVVLLGATESGQPELERFTFTSIQMAVPIKIVMYAPDKAAAERAADAAMARIGQINSVMSDYDPTSEVRRLSDTSGQGRAVPVSKDLFQVLSAAWEISERSDGAFDVTVGPVVRLWRRARRREELPSPERIAQFKQSVGYRFVRIDPANSTIELLKSEMWIDLGGIAKGYAIDEALAELRRRGITRALVDAGGDVGLGDSPPDRPSWTVGVAPLDPQADPSILLSLSNVAVATSGDMWQYVEINGRRYSHIVDPRTGIGLTDHSSVTVIAPDATTADGLASAVSVLGPKKGIELIDATPNTAALIMRAPHGKIETYRSQRWSTVPVMQPEPGSQSKPTGSVHREGGSR